MFGDDLDLDSYNPAAVDAVAAAGGQIPPGKYHARLDGSREYAAKSGTPGTELVFTVLTGPFAGTEIKDTLWKTDNDRAKSRRVLFAHRLGLVAVDPRTKKYAVVEGRQGFEDCLGAEAVVEVVHEPDQKDPAKKWPRLAFAIYDPADPKVKDVPKAKPAAKADGKPAPRPPAKPRPGFDPNEL